MRARPAWGRAVTHASLNAQRSAKIEVLDSEVASFQHSVFRTPLSSDLQPLKRKQLYSVTLETCLPVLLFSLSFKTSCLEEKNCKSCKLYSMYLMQIGQGHALKDSETTLFMQ